MPRKKKIVDTLQIGIVDFGGTFPCTLKVVYKKGTSIEKIIVEAAQTESNLIPLVQVLDEDDRVPLSMVYKQNGTTVAYMFIDDDITLDTIVHECVHVVFRLFEIVGSNINEETEEFFAYLDSDIFKKVYIIATEVFKLDPPVLYSE